MISCSRWDLTSCPQDVECSVHLGSCFLVIALIKIIQYIKKEPIYLFLDNSRPIRDGILGIDNVHPGFGKAAKGFVCLFSIVDSPRDNNR